MARKKINPVIEGLKKTFQEINEGMVKATQGSVDSMESYTKTLQKKYGLAPPESTIGSGFGV